MFNDSSKAIKRKHRYSRLAGFAVLGAFVGLVAVAEPSRATEPKPSCPIYNVPAQATLIARPDYPEATEEYASGEADITVTLSSTGAVKDVTIYKSSGSTSFDLVSLEAARQSVYTPEYTDCYAVGGTYLFRSLFDTTQ
jgi:TonB family protein